MVKPSNLDSDVKVYYDPDDKKLVSEGGASFSGNISALATLTEEDPYVTNPPGSPAATYTSYGKGFTVNGLHLLNINVYSAGVGFTGGINGSGIRVNGTLVHSTGRSWGLVVIKGSELDKGRILLANTYDVYASSSNATTMLNAISAYNTDNNVILIGTHDEPNNNALGLKETLVENYGAKLALAPMSSRGAYAYAFRNGYGSIAESHSAYFNGATLTTSGTNNTKSVAAINATILL